MTVSVTTELTREELTSLRYIIKAGCSLIGANEPPSPSERSAATKALAAIHQLLNE